MRAIEYGKRRIDVARGEEGGAIGWVGRPLALGYALCRRMGALLRLNEHFAGWIDRAVIQALLKVGQTVWNAVVLADQVGDPKWLAAVRERVAADPSMVQVEAMIAAKRRKFGVHHWLVGECELFERDGVQRLRVGARAADQVQLG